MEEKNRAENMALNKNNKENQNKSEYNSSEGFEQMSVPGGGAGNKAALDSLKNLKK